MVHRRLDASTLCDWADAAVADLIVGAEEINQLNVFPVADADTGTNMLFTMRAALAEVTPGQCLAQTAAALAGGAARGARGNSGVVLATFRRHGTADDLHGRGGGVGRSDHLDP